MRPDEITAAAVRAIRRHGPLVSMDEIAAEAGVTKPIVYRTLGDKEQIARAVSDHLVEEVDRNTTESLADWPRTEDTFRCALRSFFEILHRDRNVWVFVETGWGGSDSTHTDRLIERSAEAYVTAFTDSPATAGQPDWRRRTWSLATVGALRTTAKLWTAAPYCSLDDVVDDVMTFITNAHQRPSATSA